MKHLSKYIGPAVLVVLLLVSIGVCLKLEADVNRAKADLVRVKLQVLLPSLGAYEAEHNGLPSALNQLAVPANLLIDDFGGQPFRYINPPVPGPDGKKLVILQAASVRTGWWPWGERQRLALLAEGDIVDVAHTDLQLP